MQEAKRNDRWIRGFSGQLSVQAVAEYLDLWALVQEQPLSEVEDGVRWRLTANDAYSSKFAYAAFFVSRVAAPGAAELWSAGAPLLHKLHMWLALKHRLWTADR